MLNLKVDINKNAMRIAESELIINGDGSVFHLHLRPEELADNVILVGDPGRVDMIAEYFDEKEFRHASREFVSVTGKYKPFSICITCNHKLRHNFSGS